MKPFLLLILLLASILSGCANKTDKPYQFENNNHVSTYAGLKVYGYKDASTTKAQFFSPMGIARKGDVLYIADTNNNMIRKIEDGKVETLTGSFTKKDKFGKPIGGFKDGKLSEALFNRPTDLAVHKDGTIYVADSKNGAIRRITTDGQVETIVKNLKYPSHIVIGKDDSLYVSEKLAHRILLIDPNGKVSVLAGGGYKTKGDEVIGAYKDGIGEKAQFNEPTGLALSDTGDLFVSDTGNQRIRKIQSDGTVTTLAGGGDQFLENSTYIKGDYKDGSALDARFNFPQGIELLSDQSLMIADTLNHRIRLLQPDGQVTTLSGSGTYGYKDGIGNEVSFDGPTDIVGDDKGVYIADQYNNMIRFLSFEKKSKDTNR